MLIKTRYRSSDNKTYINIKNIQSEFERQIAALPYAELIELRSKSPKKQKAIINLELYHRYAGSNSAN